MTSKEAIEELEKGYPLEDTPTEECLKYEEAVEKAIKSLKICAKCVYFKEQHHGEWVFDKDGYFSCSCCKKKPKYQVATTDFCPWCGADMRPKEGEAE